MKFMFLIIASMVIVVGFVFMIYEVGGELLEAFAKKICPFCKSKIPKEASVCKYCAGKLPLTEGHISFLLERDGEVKDKDK